MRVRLLGSVDVTIDGTVRPVSGPRRKAVLAVLALNVREVVSSDRLIDIVWAAHAHRISRNTLQRQISYLRTTFDGRSVIVAHPPGYVLDVAADATDVEVAVRLIGLAQQSPDPARSTAYLRDALALWRGRALADVVGSTWLEEQADRLEQIRFAAVLSLVDGRLALGEHAQIVPELEDLAQQHPFDEQIHRQLMLALYRSGRQADALGTYERLRHALREDLGIDPSEMVRDLHADILSQNPGLLPNPWPIAVVPRASEVSLPGNVVPPPTNVAPAPLTWPVPAQLPPATRAFAGRVRELDQLDTLRSDAIRDKAEAVAVAVLSGMAGVGKTALAVHWSHRVADQFPDGQLYADLRGFDPFLSPLNPDEVVRGFLAALGTPTEHIPTSSDAQTALYRGLLAGKRVLVLLDNARDAEQVRPLLPSATGCLVLVTSRNELTGLVATHGAHALPVPLMSTAESRATLLRRLGADRVRQEPAAVAEIIACCAQLPLALAIVAARAVTRPHLPLSSLAEELRQACRHLDAFDGGDPATNVRSVISWSYQSLSADAARLFRLTGLHPGPDLSVPLVASLAGMSTAHAHRILVELTSGHLLTESAPGRYALHDLLCAFAQECLSRYDSDEQRHAATRRMFDHYLHTADAAAQLLYPHRDPVHLDPPGQGVVCEAPKDETEAVAWFTAESAGLLAINDRAADTGCVDFTMRVAQGLVNFLDGQGRWYDVVASQEAALSAAIRKDHRPAQALARQLLGRGEIRLGRYAEAHAHLQQAIDMHDALGDRVRQARGHQLLAKMWAARDRPWDALRHARSAVDMFRDAGHLSGQAQALNIASNIYAQLGDFQQALAHGEECLILQETIGDARTRADALGSVANALHHLGHHARAIAHCEQALPLLRQFGDRYPEAETLIYLGDALHAAGDASSAAKAWRQAQAILDELKHPDALRPKSQMFHQAAQPKQVTRV